MFQFNRALKIATGGQANFYLGRGWQERKYFQKGED